ncbi:hypothetical protein J7E86_17965 [Streptomyces sp. ISL-11]|nr:hypothetical protein [Streptomyces sp. ISL-11]
MVIDPVARRVDGESVRIARDVLCAGAVAKICLPDGPEDVERALARRGRRRPVVIGDDRALLQAVRVLHRRRELPEVPVSLVPVGTLPAVSLARTLGVPLGSVAAARAVLDGAERRMDALLDDSGGMVLGGLWIPGANGLNRSVDARETRVRNEPNGADITPEGGETSALRLDDVPAPASAPEGAGVPAVAERPDTPAVTGTGGQQPWWSPAARTARSALTLLTGPAARLQLPSCTRLRVEADGVLLADLDQPVARVAVSTVVGGLAEVVIHTHAAGRPVRTRARRVTVSGPGFGYRADNVLTGPVRTRTWTAHEEAWRLVLPRG